MLSVKINGPIDKDDVIALRAFAESLAHTSDYNINYGGITYIDEIILLSRIVGHFEANMPIQETSIKAS